jgi:hypothetical protein
VGVFWLTRLTFDLKFNCQVRSFRYSGGTLTLGTAKVSVVCETMLAEPALLVTLPGGLKLTAWHPVLTQDPACLPLGGANGGPTMPSKVPGFRTWAFPAHLAHEAGAAVNGAAGALTTATTLSGNGGRVSAGHASLNEVPSVFNFALEPDKAAAEEESGVVGSSFLQWHGALLAGGATPGSNAWIPTITLGHGLVDEVAEPVAAHAYYGSTRVLEDLHALPEDPTRGGRVVLTPSGLNTNSAEDVTLGKRAPVDSVGYLEQALTRTSIAAM